MYGREKKKGAVMGVKRGGLPCSGSWFCGGVIPKGDWDEEGEVE